VVGFHHIGNSQIGNTHKWDRLRQTMTTAATTLTLNEIFDKSYTVKSRISGNNDGFEKATDNLLQYFTDRISGMTQRLSDAESAGEAYLEEITVYFAESSEYDSQEIQESFLALFPKSIRIRKNRFCDWTGEDPINGHLVEFSISYWEADHGESNEAAHRRIRSLVKNTLKQL